MKFQNMGNRPLEYAVYCKTKEVIPAGATGVKIAFRQSHLTRWDNNLKQHVKMNVYIWKGNVYHA